MAISADAVIHVANVPPTADAGGHYRTLPGVPLLLSGSGRDPGDDELSYAWDLSYDGETFAPMVAGSNVWHAFEHEGRYLVALRVSDDDTSTVAPATVSVRRPATILLVR